MEFLDEDARPRFLFQARANPSSATKLEDEPQSSKLFIFIALFASSILLSLSIFFVHSEPFRSILIWISLSLILGPFAPISVTGGDIRVGQGSILEIPTEESEVEEDTKKRVVQKRSKPRRSEAIVVQPIEVVGKTDKSLKDRDDNRNGAVESNDNGVRFAVEEMDWEEGEIGILKKQLAKNPPGKPRRWEIITEAFGGRHKLESVIKMAKELGEKKLSDGDSYAQFLKNRKPVDKRIDGVDEEPVGGGSGADGWNSGEDIALLNALKAFPKDAPMRWEKIAAALPGKSKADCMKRVVELKRNFRNVKAANEN